ncbi:MAG: 16S rRNA (uracil(1498)-N(3))-methyltransferase [Ignavibacteriaceae bacterium]|nr:16S rRNA (uracil(1498)-N(3))-methyltransferase [Ignavibacteriaceae bacterium]
MTLEHLSNIELYYTSIELITEDNIILTGDEFHHSINVMRNSVDDKIFVSDGKGTIYTAQIATVSVNHLSANIIERRVFENKAGNIWFCIPILKNPDKLKFAFEKCVELGITNFILFSSRYTLSKKVKPEKFHKTVLAAMKQSLRAFLPQIHSASFTDIIKLDGHKILFDQNARIEFEGKVELNKRTYFLFGPEGGFDINEIELVEQQNRFNLSTNRLRSETAIIKCASLLKI